MSSASPVPWGDFSQDPRRSEAAAMRASDRDRDVVHGVLAEGFADGRLSREEYDERSAATTAAKTLGELPPIIADLVPLTGARSGTGFAPATEDDLDRQALSRWERQRTEAINGFVFIAVVTWVIWAVTSGVHSFPWPIFPTLFVGMRVPQVLMNKREIVARERARLEKKQHRAVEGRDTRDDRGTDDS
jgi:hypothetical protein